jgi:MarR family transcriptional regulator, organic hydroperoxide resistance regulator
MDKKYTETVDSKIKVAWQIISRMYNIEAAKHDGTMAEAHFLLNIDSHEGSYASEIAPRLGMQGTSMSRIIKTLSEEKVIKLLEEKKDKRKVKIILTQKGKEKKELSKMVVRNFNSVVEEKIGKKRLSEFYETIAMITEIAEQRHKTLL